MLGSIGLVGGCMRTGLFIVLCAAMVATVAFVSAANLSNEDMSTSSAPLKSGLYLNQTQEYTRIDLDDVKSVIKAEIPGVNMETLSGGLIDDRVYGKLWQFTFSTEADKSILMGVDAESGDIMFFFGRTGKIAPDYTKISLEQAKQIALDYIKERDGDRDLTLVTAQYIDPHAEGLPGEYLVRYSRVIGEVRCLSDGITVTIHPATGCVMSYYKSWTMPEDQVPDDVGMKVSESEAAVIVADYMAENGAQGVRILSSEMQWVDLNYPASLKDSHDIRLAWHVRFTDDYYHLHEVTFPAAAWVDAETGEILKCLYSLD